MTLLADTGALLAFMLKRDQHHGAAVRFLQQQPKARFVTSDLILSELVTRIRARSSAAQAAAVGRSLALDGAFAFDRDFRDCGYKTYPEG